VTSGFRSIRPAAISRFLFQAQPVAAAIAPVGNAATSSIAGTQRGRAVDGQSVENEEALAAGIPNPTGAEAARPRLGPVFRPAAPRMTSRLQTANTPVWVSLTCAALASSGIPA
jgi:hypothetical protein